MHTMFTLPGFSVPVQMAQSKRVGPWHNGWAGPCLAILVPQIGGVGIAPSGKVCVLSHDIYEV